VWKIPGEILNDHKHCMVFNELSQTHHGTKLLHIKLSIKFSTDYEEESKVVLKQSREITLQLRE
jgi:hypothetical protein